MSHNQSNNEREDDAWGGDDWDNREYDNEAYDNEQYEDDEHEGATGPCPECGAELHVDAETCYACGHWLSTAERHQLWDGGSPVRGAMSVGKVVLVAVLIALLSGLLVL